MSSELSERVAREKQYYNTVDFQKHRRLFSAALTHSQAYFVPQRLEIIKGVFNDREIKRVLELGSMSWYYWFLPNSIKPDKMICINISESELEKGKQYAQEVGYDIDFKIMDAHYLEFEKESFDLVFGGGILHHLDFSRAIAEVHRVLKKDGRILFYEPLSSNPIAKLFRRWTPGMRTRDERPLGKGEIAELCNMFDCKVYYEQLFSVPVSVISRMFFKKPRNILTKLAFGVDTFLRDRFEFLGRYYRTALIIGRNKSERVWPHCESGEELGAGIR